MSEERMNAPVVTTPSEAVAKEKSPHILVVDDDRVILHLLGKVLRKFGFCVALANSGQDALSLIRGTAPDVILLDIKMPGMDGITTLKEIKAHDSDIEVVIMTGFASLDSAVEALRYGAFDYIKKPFNQLDQVVNAIRQAWERRRPRLQGRTKEASLERRIYELKVLYNLSRTLGACLEGDEMMAELLDSLSKLIGYDLAISLWTEWSEAKRLLLQIAKPSSPNFIEEARCNLIDAFNSVSFAKISKNTTFDRVLGEEKINDESEGELRIASKLNSFLNVPLMDNKKIVGMINVSNHLDRSFSSDDIRLIYTSVSQIPLAPKTANRIEAAKWNGMERLAENISQGVIVVDENLTVAMANQIAQEILDEKNPTYESIQKTLGLDLGKLKKDLEERDSGLIRTQVKIDSQRYAVITSLLKGTAETFEGFVVSLHPLAEEKQDR
jgi:CheY-like chemotaxis protein